MAWKVVLLVLVGVALSAGEQSVLEQFSDFVQKFGKTYKSSHERLLRLAAFNETLARVAMLNSQGGATFGINQFSDLTPKEFKAKYLMSKYSAQHHDDVETTKPQGAAPSAFDWRTGQSKKPVTPVKNQEQCGSCWAFSATETIEAGWILAGNSQVILGPQQIVDCDTSDDGCNGGETETAYAYVISAGGQETEANYPYTAQDGTCAFSKSKVAVTISSWKYGTNNNDETTMQANLASISPMSICVDASSWQDYSSGVLLASQCGNSVDHCVQAVGYDTTKNPPFWSVRNSWGESWGMSGYIELEFGQNTCACASDVTYVIAGNNPTSSSTATNNPTGNAADNEVEADNGGKGFLAA